MVAMDGLLIKNWRFFPNVGFSKEREGMVKNPSPKRGSRGVNCTNPDDRIAYNARMKEYPDASGSAGDSPFR